MPELRVKAFERGENSIEYIIEHNLQHAKDVITKDINGTSEFSPTLFIITKDTMFYILLDTKMAQETRCSPLDQVAPMLDIFRENKMGTILTYQVIGEAWMKKMKTETEGLEKLRYGDISKMAGRIEVLMQVVGDNKGIKFTTFEMKREVDSDKILQFKEMDTSEGSIESGKFPVL